MSVHPRSATPDATPYTLPAGIDGPQEQQHGPDPPSHARDQEKPHPDLVPFGGNSLRTTDAAPLADRSDHSRARANTAPSDLLPPLMSNGGIGDSPHPALRSLAPHARQKRSSFTTFFAFSSKRPTHGTPIVLPKLQQDLVPPQSVSGGGQSYVHLVNPASIPSPLRADDDDEYYYSSYYPSSPADALNRAPSRQLSIQPRPPDLDSRLSSPVDSRLSHTQIRHPYAYSTPLYSKPYPKPVDPSPRLRHVSSQPFHHYPEACGSGVNAEPVHNRTLASQLGHDASKSHPHRTEPEIKTSMSTPNLLSGANPIPRRSLLRKKPTARSKERWLSTESWWNALFSPSPRFKVKQAPPYCGSAADGIVNTPINRPIQGELSRSLSVTFPSVPAARPRAASVASPTSNTRPTVPSFARSRSAMDLSDQPPTFVLPSCAGFEPALETLVDQPTPPPDRTSSCGSELSPPPPPLSLEQVLDEGEAFEQQRAQWKQQASRSIGNKHARSFSRARSKSLCERQVRFGRHGPENSKPQMHLEFLTARTLLGSQSMMPVVHVSKASNSLSHSKAYSHSHSQSAYSSIHSSHSRAYSHSHSHSLTTSNSSKSSRNPPRAHSRNGSWGKTFLKAGALCGIGQEDSSVENEKVPSSSRVDVQGANLTGHSIHAEQGSGNGDKVAPAPCDPTGEVGIAISSSPALDGTFDLTPRHQESVQEKRHTHKSSDYAGPHPSNLPPLANVNDVSLRHRLPPRPAIYPPIAHIPHPYRSATVQPLRVGDRESQGATSRVTKNPDACTGRTPHLSLSNPDFEQYGIGEALVYAAPRPPVPEVKSDDAQSESSPVTELSSPEEQSPPHDIVGLQSDRDSPSVAMQSVPSLTGSTIQMVMSAFNNPDDFDEFQDLFYKPHSAPDRRHWGPSVSVSINQVPTDVQSSTSSSPLTHLVRKLSEEVHSLRIPSRAPSDPIILQRSESQDTASSGAKLVFMDVARTSSPPPLESPSQLHVAIQEPSDSAASSVSVVPEDVNLFDTSSVVESSLEDRENDTFGYPIKHGQLEVAIAPAPTHSPFRLSTHPSIEQHEGDTDENETAFLSPATRRYGLVSVDAVRASYLTTSDLSRMSGLSDFPLPPGARPVSIPHAYEAPSSPSSSSSDGPCQSDEETEMGHRDRSASTEGEANEDGMLTPTGDVEETLRALRMTPHTITYESRRSTFGGSEDMDYITKLHQAGP